MIRINFAAARPRVRMSSAGKCPWRRLGAAIALCAGLMAAPAFADTGMQTILHLFTNPDQSWMTSGLVKGSDGYLYGTSELGITVNNQSGYFYKLSPSGDFSVLHQFTQSEGQISSSGLVLASDGNFYGLTDLQGGNGLGSVVRLTPAGALTAIHSFVSSEGFSPAGAMTQGADGRLYGTLSRGTSAHYGSVFATTLSGQFSVLHAFTGGSEGGYPQGMLAQGADGNFYGATAYSNGSIFKITPAGALTTLYVFSGPEGSVPRGGLTLGADGNFYGIASKGGAYGNGAVFSITPTGTYTNLHSFTNAEGSGFAGLVLGSDGNLYGNTWYTSSGSYGQVFMITAGGMYTTLFTFNGNNGALSEGLLVLGDNNTIFGNTSAGGGQSGTGVVYRLDPLSDPPPTSPTVALTADTTSVVAGQAVTFTWSSSGAQACYADGTWSKPEPLSGSEVVTVSQVGSNSYGMICTGAGALGMAIPVVVTAATPPPSITLTPSKSSAAVGPGSIGLTWSTTNAQSCTSSGDWSGTRTTAGSGGFDVVRVGDNIYTLSCTGTGGTSAKTVIVTGVAIPTLTISANPTQVGVGQTSVLNWTSAGATSCTASGFWTGSEPTSGTQTVTITNPGSSNTYTLSCTGTGGTATQSVSVTGLRMPTIIFNTYDAYVAAGQNTTLNWSSSDAASCTASGAWGANVGISGSQSVVVPSVGNNIYTLTCSNAVYSASKSVTVVGAAPPTITMSFNPVAVIAEQTSVFTWDTTDASTCTLNGSPSGLRGSQTRTISEGVLSYTLSCSGVAGSATKTASVGGYQPVTLGLSSGASSVPVGQSVTLTWASTNAYDCAASGQWSGAKSYSSSQAVAVIAAGSNAYTLVCTNPASSVTQTVTVTGVPVPVVTLSASPTSVPVGQTSTLNWTSSDATSCQAFGGWSGSQALSGGMVVAVPSAGANSYSLACTGAGGTTTQSVTVTGQPPPTLAISTFPTSAAIGGNTTISWTTTNTTSCTASGGWSGAQATSGSASVPVAHAGANAYVLDCTGPGGSVSQAATATGVAPPTVTISAAASSAPVGQSTTVSWTTTDATSCVTSGAWSGSRPTSGSEIVTINNAGSNTYGLTCGGIGGSATQSAAVAGLAAPTLSLAATPGSAIVGQAATLNWTASNATSCVASGGWSGAQPAAGSQAVAVSTVGANNYGLSCSGGGGTVTQTATVTGLAPASLSFTATPATVGVGSSTTLSWSSTGVSSCTASGAWSGAQATAGSVSVPITTSGSKNFSLSCSGSGGDVSKSASVTAIPAPTVSLSASPSSVLIGQSSTLSWSSTDSTSCTASGNWSGAQATSGTRSVSVSAGGSNSYNLNCSGIGGTTSRSAVVTGTLPTVGFQVAAESTPKAATSTNTIAVILSSASPLSTTVPYTLSGTASSSSYTVTPAGTLTIPAGSTSANLTLKVTSSSCNKTVIMTLGTPTNATVGSSNKNTLTMKTALLCN